MSDCDADTVCITIGHPNDWFHKVHWIETTCGKWEDHTDWSLWSLGLANIEYWIHKKYAIIYYLTWGH